MGMNMVDAFKTFVNAAQKQHGSNFDPASIAKNMTGGKYNTPKEALDAFLREGRINQQQYDIFINMI